MTEAPSQDDHDAYRAWCEKHGFPYIPGFVARMPVWAPSHAILPCCSLVLSPAPQKGGKCPACGDPYRIRTCPDGVRRILNETAYIEVCCLNAELGIASRSISIIAADVDDAEFEEIRLEGQRELRRIARARVLAKHGRGPAIDAQGNPIEP